MTNPCASYYDSDGCLVTPECPAIAEVPARIDRSPIVGWTAGALSTGVQRGDASLRFQMPPGVVGVVIGLKANGVRPTMPSLVTHGFYFQRAIGDYFQVIERGIAKTTLRPRTATDLFEVRRVGGVVTYWQNGQRIYRSDAPSTGIVLANCCLYSSGDAAPARFDPDAPPTTDTNPILVGYTDIAFAVMEGTVGGIAGGQMVQVGEGSLTVEDMSQQSLFAAVGKYDVYGDFAGHVHVDIDADSPAVTSNMYALLDFADHESVTVAAYASAGVVFATIGERFYDSDQFTWSGILDAAPGTPQGFNTAGEPDALQKFGDSQTFTKAELVAAGFFDYLAAHSGDFPPPRILVGAYQYASNGDPGLDVVFTYT